MPIPSAAKRAFRWIYYPALGFITYDFIHNNVARLQWVTGASMSPTLSPNYHEKGSRDLVLVVKCINFLPWRSVFSDLRRGDIVVMPKPHDPGHDSVKRVVALPGDTVFRDARRVGKQADEAGRYSKDLGLEMLEPAVKIPQGCCWVEGDSWRVSRDSNDFGPITQSLINGRVWGVVWPLSRWGAFPRSEIDRQEMGYMGMITVAKGRRVRGPDSATVVIEGTPDVLIPMS